MAEPIRVLICDDHPMVRQGLRAFLDALEDIEVAGEATDGGEASRLTEELLPDVVLMDLVMPNVDGIEAIRRIRAVSPSARIIVLTSFADDDNVFPAIKAGALGYLLKDVSPQELARAIRMARDGEALLAPGIARRLMEELARGTGAHGGVDRLTERELEVLGLLARGRSNKEIALELVLSEKTVKTHVSNILQKLHVADRTQAALLAVRQKLVDLP